MRQMKGNFYNKRPISHLGMFLNIDMRKHHSRKCHTHFRTHTYTHSIRLYWFTITPSRTHYHWKQYAKEPACKGNRQPGASLYYNSHNINHTKHIWLIFFVKQVQDHSMFWDQYLSQSHAHRCAELYLTSDRDRLHFDAIPRKPIVLFTIQHSDEYQQDRSFAGSWALCRETGNVKCCTYQSLWTAIRKAKVLSDYTEN